jgi:hypothetical protein
MRKTNSNILFFHFTNFRIYLFINFFVIGERPAAMYSVARRPSIVRLMTLMLINAVIYLSARQRSLLWEFFFVFSFVIWWWKLSSFHSSAPINYYFDYLFFWKKITCTILMICSVFPNVVAFTIDCSYFMLFIYIHKKN